MSTFSDYLDPDSDIAHYGVKGMKWGVRKNRSGASLGKKAKTLKKKIEKKRVEVAAKKVQKKADKLNSDSNASINLTLKNMSDADLQKAIQRMDMERRYTSLVASPKEQSIGRRVAQDILVGAARNVGTSYLTSVGNRSLKKLDKNY